MLGLQALRGKPLLLVLRNQRDDGRWIRQGCIISLSAGHLHHRDAGPPIGPRAGWAHVLRLEWLRNTVQPPGPRTHLNQLVHEVLRHRRCAAAAAELHAARPPLRTVTPPRFCLALSSTPPTLGRRTPGVQRLDSRFLDSCTRPYLPCDLQARPPLGNPRRLVAGDPRRSGPMCWRPVHCTAIRGDQGHHGGG